MGQGEVTPSLNSSPIHMVYTSTLAPYKHMATQAILLHYILPEMDKERKYISDIATSF